MIRRALTSISTTARAAAAAAAAVAVAGSLAVVVGTCAAAAARASSSPDAGSAPPGSHAAAELRLGYFANVTHATPLVGVAHGDFAKALGATKLTTQVYNAGPAEMTALLGGQLDAAYVGPSSALSAFVQSHGQAVRIVAGATSGGAELVVRDGIDSAADLRGKTIATPQKGNTQDVALRSWLQADGLTANADGTGDVSVAPQDNAATLDQFEAGHIDGAWLPEPWASRLVLEAHAKVLLDERSLWPDQKFSTTVLVVSTAFLDSHPDSVRALIDGQIAANSWITKNGAAAQSLVNDELERLTGKPLTPSEIARAFSEQSVTNDPLASTLQTSFDHAVSAGLTKKADLHGIVDLGILDQELAEHGEKAASESGLGR